MRRCIIHRRVGHEAYDRVWADHRSCVTDDSQALCDRSEKALHVAYWRALFLEVLDILTNSIQLLTS